ncbi:MAG TPA: glycosyltransferase family A protein [Phenylobacterium sp.]
MSIVMPVRDGARYIVAAIEGLQRSDFQDFELIVVDDASSDGSGDIAAAMGATVIRSDRWIGGVSGRMSGVKRARGDILAFVDADVVVHPRALSQIVERFAANPETSAVIGGYDDAPRAPSVLSRFRNLLHAYFHRRAAHDARTFWTGLGAVRRDAFETVGGFAHGPGMDDVEFGIRLHEAGFGIMLDASIQGTHLKIWTLPLMVKTDIFMRGAPWIRLALERGFFRNDMNTSVAQRASVASAGLLLVALAIAAVAGGLPVLASAFGAGFALAVAGWGDADRGSPGPVAGIALMLVSLLAAGGLLLVGAWPAAAAVVVAASVRCLARPAYGSRPDAAGLALVASVGLAFGLSVAAAPPSIWGVAALAALALYVGLAWRILAFMGARMGLPGALAALPLLLVYHLSCGLAVGVGLLGHFTRRPGPAWTTLAVQRTGVR